MCAIADIAVVRPSVRVGRVFQSYDLARAAAERESMRGPRVLVQVGSSAYEVRDTYGAGSRGLLCGTFVRGRSVPGGGDL